MNLGYIGYKVAFYHSFGWFCAGFSTFFILFNLGMIRSIDKVCKISIRDIDLHQCGTLIDVTNLAGEKRTIEISHMRVCTNEELYKIHEIGGPATIEKLKDFYPVLLDHPSKGGSYDLIMLDHKANVEDH